MSPSTTNEQVTVKSIKRIKLDEAVPVYDATVPKYHNFCLGDGVVVHNTAKNARNNYNQEVLKLTGKILNCLTADVSKVLNSKAVRNIILALGANIKEFDVKADKPTFNCDKLRVQYIFLLSDADPDGCHINVLLLGLLYRFFPDLLKDGRVFVVDAPLYNALYKDKHYGAMTWEECREKMPSAAPDKLIGRAKGWGEVDVDMLEAIAFEPTSRNLLRIGYPDSATADLWFNGIAGDSADARKQLLGIVKREDAV